MKYVKTKNGLIFEKHDTYFENKYFTCTDEKTLERLFGRIIKQVDSIEELFDELVLVAPYRFKKPKTATELEKDFQEMTRFYTSEDDTIYGAIWTDEGLIYKAKMKGVLPNGEIDWELL